MYDDSPTQQRGLLTLPIVFIAVVSGELAQGISRSIDLGAVSTTIFYAAALTLPIAIKWIVRSIDLKELDPQEQPPYSRLPTSRFPTVPGRPSSHHKGTFPQFSN